MISPPIGDKTVTEGELLSFTVVALDPDGDPLVMTVDPDPGPGWSFTDNGDGTADLSWTTALGDAGAYPATFTATDDFNPPGTDSETITITVLSAGDPIANGDTYATPVGDTLTVSATRLSGVLYNDRLPASGGGTGDPLADLEAVLVDGPTNGTLDTGLGLDGSFTYTPNGLADNSNDSFTYYAQPNGGDGSITSAVTTVNIAILSKQTDFKMMMNYELGMHCTGFEFAYCCVLPPYNSIVSQIVKPAAADPAQDPCVTQSCSDSISGNQNNFLDGFPRLLDGTAEVGVDGLGRETVVRSFDTSGNFIQYQLKYTHDAQPRREGNGKSQSTTLISDVEGNSMLYTDTTFDGGTKGADGQLDTTGTSRWGPFYGVIQGDGDLSDATDNYANAWLNHFYIYAGLEGAQLCVDQDSNDANVVCETDNFLPGPSPVCPKDGIDENNGTCGNSQESNKTRLGIDVVYPKNVGAALQPMGPNGNVSGFDNVLTYTTDTGTVVWTQMKVLENLPIMLTSPRIWEALGLPLTPFEDSIKFFDDPGMVDEDSIRPYVAMKAALVEYPTGNAVFGDNGQPVIGFGTAPIDIPNCERCHSAPACKDPEAIPGTAACDEPAEQNLNSPNLTRGGEDVPYNQDEVDPIGTVDTVAELTNFEIEYWNSFYDIIDGVDSDWYSRLKGAAINMLLLHDIDMQTTFTDQYPGLWPGEPTLPQNTRLGKDSVLCQRCHADNVIATVKSACKVDPTSTVLCPDGAPGTRQIIQPITEAIHWNHRGTDEIDPVTGLGGPIRFSDGAERDGGCQGCHPAHRSDGVMDNYPITLDGDNVQAGSDNRLALGGCFVGRDVHSNPFKDSDGAGTDSYLNPVGQYLADNVFNDQAGVAGSPVATRGLWCTNCHQQLSQELWKAENVYDLINGKGVCVDVNGNNDGQACANNGECLTAPFDDSCALTNVRELDFPGDGPNTLADALGYTSAQLEAWLDPTDNNTEGDTTHSIWNPDVTNNTFPFAGDGAVALIEATFVDEVGCNPTADFEFELPRFGGAFACLSFDGDPGGATGFGDPNVRVLDFCTTQDCIDAANHLLMNETGSTKQSFAFPAPFDAATDGRDHWLAPGEPHCADCHLAPYVEQSGNINPFPPFNYPRKASLMRYSRGHQDVTCQGCHESIHGLYPVTPTIDTTSYAQAAALNADGSHGPLKCATCHAVTVIDGDAPGNGVPTTAQVDGGPFQLTSFEEAVTFAHTYTDNANPLESACESCHLIEEGGDIEPTDISATNKEYLIHSMVNRTSRKTMDLAEITQLGHVIGDVPDPKATGICQTCHKATNTPKKAKCNSSAWRKHLTEGRVSVDTWVRVSNLDTGSSCGW